MRRISVTHYYYSYIMVLVLISSIATTKTINAFIPVRSLPSIASKRLFENVSTPPFSRPNEKVSKTQMKLDNNKINSISTNESEILNGDALISTVVDDDQQDSVKSAITNTIFTVGATGIFGSLLWLTMGNQAGEEFFAGYLIEQSLSVDNLFVFVVLFEYFQVPEKSQNRVLKWGIFGAMAMRAIMVTLGLAALESFKPLLLVFASILVFSSFKILVGEEEEEEDMSENSIVKFSQSLFDSTDYYDGERFFTLEDGIKKATPLLICLIAVELSDVVFAVDSIPAVFGVTENPFIVYTSNIFAIMGLRSLYTVLSKAAKDLEYLETAVAIVLGFIGSKMILEFNGVCIPTQVSLGVVATLLGGGVGLSVLKKQEDENVSS